MRQKVIFTVPYALWILLFVIAPLVLIFYQSFFNIDGQVTLGNYATYLTSGVYLKMTLNSVWYAFLITLVTLVISYPTAYVLNHLPNRQFWLLLVILPTWINLLLKTYAFIGLFSRTGTVNQFLQFVGLGSHQLLFTDASFMFVAAYIEIPFMVLPIFNSLAEINPSLINASKDLGASQWQTFTKVVWPLSLPGVKAGIQAVFIPSLSLFMITRLIGGNRVITLGTAIEEHFLTTQNWGMGSTIGVILILAMFIVMFVTGEGRQKGGTALMKKHRFTWGGLYLALVFVILYAPILYLMIFSFSAGKTMEKYHGFSFQHYTDLFADSRMITIVINTLIVALLASLIATIIGTMGALVIKDSRGTWRNSLLSLNNVLMVSPDVIIGASFLIFFTVLGIRLGFVSVLLSHIAFCIPIVVLMVLPKLNELSPTLVDAAYDLGASRWQTLSRVILPAIAPGIFAGYFMALTYSLDDFAVTFFVTGNGFSTLSVEIYSRARQGINLEINALSTLMFIVSLLLVVGYYFISKHSGRRNRIVAVKEGDAQ